ncbi:lysine/arginine/ornithine ABC transporter substrate-binding protein [Aeromonas simiae]|uniref:Transporter substrate-binding domain-containing protein n=1 Tax=Aeromonas simiae TaxID=218936 RepID=A0A5J6WZY7_9GAMM|nr:lysine/arginine/ornithine ABC transporter substrate-binding protein [Aeromonas simiae]QFI56060.1 transporter substrate-binding domain-containing protein [Aeromonas simiae]
MKKAVLLLAAVGMLAGQAVAKEVKFATEATYPPFEYIDDKNEFQGFDIELARAICAEAKLECTFHNQAFDSLIPSLKFRRYDVAIAAMDITPERAAQVDFSDIYYENSAVFVSKKGAFKSPEALTQKTVGVQNGTSHQTYVQDNWTSKGVLSVPYASYQNAFLDMLNGRIDAVFADTAVAAEWLKKQPEYAMLGDKVTDTKYFGTGFGMAVAKGNGELLGQLNAGLKAVKANGTYQKIYDKYFSH